MIQLHTILRLFTFRADAAIPVNGDAQHRTQWDTDLSLPLHGHTLEQLLCLKKAAEKYTLLPCKAAASWMAEPCGSRTRSRKLQ